MSDDAASRIEWWPVPREGETVPDHPPVDLTPFAANGSFTAEPMEGASEAMERYVRRIAAAEHAIIEKAAEMAVQAGICGIRVWRYNEGLTVSVDPSVPYGHIYEMPHGQRPQELDDPG